MRETGAARATSAVWKPHDLSSMVFLVSQRPSVRAQFPVMLEFRLN